MDGETGHGGGKKAWDSEDSQPMGAGMSGAVPPPNTSCHLCPCFSYKVTVLIGTLLRLKRTINNYARTAGTNWDCVRSGRVECPTARRPGGVGVEGTAFPCPGSAWQRKL